MNARRLLCIARGGCRFWVNGADRSQRYWFKCSECKRQVREGTR